MAAAGSVNTERFWPSVAPEAAESEDLDLLEPLLRLEATSIICSFGLWGSRERSLSEVARFAACLLDAGMPKRRWKKIAVNTALENRAATASKLEQK